MLYVMSLSESPRLTEMKPVVLGNDDFDEDLTHVKEVAQSEFSRNHGTSIVNVSGIQAVQVTPENVSDLYNDIAGTQTQYSSFQCGQVPQSQHNTQEDITQDSCPFSVDTLVHFSRSLPKEMFISKVIKDSSANRERLENVRLDLLERLQQSDGYPFGSKVSLKKRVHTRSGDSVEYKLSQDIYCLVSVVDGADWEDLRPVLNIPRSKKPLSSQNPCDVSFQAVNITEIELLKKAVQSLTADMVAIKQENNLLKSEMTSELKSLRSDLKQLSTDISADLSEVRAFISTNAQSIDRLCDERSNGVANLRSDIRQMKDDLKTMSDDPVFSVNISSVNNSAEKISSFDKRLSRLEKRVNSSAAGSSEAGVQPQHTHNAQPSAATQTPAVMPRQRPAVEERQPVGTSNEKQSTQNQPAVEAGSLQQSHVNKTNGSALVRGNDSLLFSRVHLDTQSITRGKAQETPSPGAQLITVASNVQQKDCRDSKRNAHNQDISKAGEQPQPVRTVIGHGANQSHMSKDSRSTETERRLSDSKFQNQIPVYIRGSMQGHKTDTFRASQMPPDRTPESILSDDIDFTTFVRKRTKRYYIGGFKSSITRDKLIAYVESKGLTVTWLNIWTSRRSGRAIIRLNVEMTEGFHAIAEPGFWPKGIKCRPWVTKSKYNASRNTSRNHAQYSPDNDYDEYDKYDQVQNSNEYDWYDEHDQYADNGLHY